MGKHGAVILRRVDKPASTTIASASSRALSRSTRPPAPRMSSQNTTPNKGTPQMPANWSLWRPDNGIVFGGASGASAAVETRTTTTAVASTMATSTSSAISTPRAFVPRAAASSPLQTPPIPAVTFAQKTPTYFVHTTMPIRFSPNRAMHSMAQKTDAVEEDAGKETSVEAKEDEAPKEREDLKENDTKETDAGKTTTEILAPETTLDFKIPDDIFRAARDAPEGTPESFWTYAMYRQVQADKKEDSETSDDKSDKNGADSKNSSTDKAPTTVKVHYCRSMHTTERVCKEYFLGEPLLGFDLEWMASATRWDSARRNVCLVQLASPSRIGLFHLSQYPAKDDMVAPTLRKILQDPASIKAGVAIKGDARRMFNFLHVDMKGLMELSHMHKLVKYSRSGEINLINKRLVSMAVQVQEHLRLPMYKGDDVRSGNWFKPLQMDQILYSASDAYAAVQIFSVLENQREALDPKPPRPAFCELDIPIKLADGVVASAAVEEGDENAADDGDAGGSTRKLSSKFLDKAKGTVNFEPEDDDAASPATPKTKKTSGASTPKTPRTPKSPAKPKDARIVAAEEWLARFRTTASSSGLTIRAKPASLRAYHLWHSNDDLDPVTLAALLRDPPLQTNTVVSYILEAVQLERLPYLKTRLHSELLEQVPREFLIKRYSSIVRTSGFNMAGIASTATGSFAATKRATSKA